jgi:hypothetical protein
MIERRVAQAGIEKSQLPFRALIAEAAVAAIDRVDA